MKYRYDTVLLWPSSVRMRFNISGVFPMPPMGIATLAAWLRKHGKSVYLIDMPGENLDYDALKDMLCRITAPIFGISATLFNLDSAFQTARIIRQIQPETLIVLGGPVTVFPPAVLLKGCSAIDVIVNGEGEMPMLNLCRGTAPKDIAGLSSRDGGSVRCNPPSSPLAMDSIPLPWRDGLRGRYRMHPPYGVAEPVSIVETSRGCSYRCAFCGIPKVYRERTVPQIMKEIKAAVIDHGAREIYFTDPNFTAHRNRTLEVCREIIRQRIDFVWTCKTRTDLVDPELLLMMKKAGCYMISYGIESTSPALLKIMGKALEPDISVRALKWTAEAGIRTLAYMLTGAPGEQWRHIEKDLEVLAACKPDFVLFNRVVPMPEPDMDTHEAEALLDYYLGRGTRDFGDLDNVIKVRLIRSYIRFYLYPSPLFRRLFSMRSIGDLKAATKAMYYTVKDGLIPTLF